MGVITIESAATDQLLTTVARVKLDLGISGSAQDAVLAEIIDEMSAAIVHWTGRVWGEQDYQETVAGYGDEILQLTHTPLIGTPSEILLSSNAVTGFVVHNAEAGQLYLRGGWLHTAVIGWGMASYKRPGSEEADFAVTYTAGYYLPGWTEPSGVGWGDDQLPLPTNIERACVLAVKEEWLSRQESDRITSKKVGPLTITKGGGPSTAVGGAGPLSPAVTALLPARRMF